MLAEIPLMPSACAVQRRLRAHVDPFSTFAALASEGQDKGLFEGKDGRTLMMHQAAVRAECRGDKVVLHALSSNGESLVRSLGAALVRHLVEWEGPTKLILSFPPDLGLDAEARLLALSPLHAIRSLLQAALPPGGELFGAGFVPPAVLRGIRRSRPGSSRAEPARCRDAPWRLCRRL